MGFSRDDVAETYEEAGDNAFYGQKLGDDVIYPVLEKGKKFILIEVGAQDDEEMDATVTVSGLTDEDVQFIFTQMFFTLNGR